MDGHRSSIRHGRIVRQAGLTKFPWLATLRACLPGLSYQVIGKPEALLYRLAMNRLHLAADDILAIGDTPATDGLGARRAGMTVVLVGQDGEGGGQNIRSLQNLMACV